MATPPARNKSQRPGAPAAGSTASSTRLLISGLVIGIVVVAIAVGVYVAGGGSDGSVASGLPRTADYHSLLVSPTDANTLVLGTHEGLFRSTDGGLTWAKSSLAGSDAMNLAQSEERTVWAAGHNVLSRSVDGGTTWEDVRPSGLPGLDVHGFAVDPRDPARLLAAIAGQGLFGSTDGGASFALVSREVGPAVMAVAILPNGRVLAGDMATGALVGSDDDGTTWKKLIEASVMGLAVNSADPDQVLASGPGVLRSSDGGNSWQQALRLDAGTGPVAWSKSNPGTAYVVGFDRSLYRTGDAGTTWTKVAAGEG